MRPLKLKLLGFSGIRAGLGRDDLELDFQKFEGAQLVALVGPNGTGKTTVLDNMTPFRLMPSRAGDGMGNFSFYEHLCLPECLRELVWEHDGLAYRSQLVFRMNGKRKTEAYLHIWTNNCWRPVVLSDGTIADGKTDTYDRCVESILGSASTFFTSVFSAQGRRPLCDYRNAEIKALLGDLLGLEEVRTTGQKAADVVRLARAGLMQVRTELATVATQHAEQAAKASRAPHWEAELAAAFAAKKEAETAAATCAERLAVLRARHGVAEAVQQQRAGLEAERRQIEVDRADAVKRLKDENARLIAQLRELDKAAAARAEARRTRERDLTRRVDQLKALLSLRSAVCLASKRLSLRGELVARRRAAVETARKDLEAARQAAVECKHLADRIAAVEREAGQAELGVRGLRDRFGLAREVPCAGMPLQASCKLLGNAGEAQAMIPSAEARLVELGAERKSLRERSITAEAVAAHCPSLAATLERAQQRLARSDGRLANATGLAARCDELGRADTDLRIAVEELDALTQAETSPDPQALAERARLQTEREGIAARLLEVEEHAHRALTRISRAVTQLPPAVAGSELAAAESAVAGARRTVAEQDTRMGEATRAHQAAMDAAGQAKHLSERQRELEDRVQAVEAELSVWALLAKALSNDGVVALSIDDTGPALAALANDLLVACYGGRFTVSIRTQVETAKGEAREGFDIAVHDALSDQTKSVSVMSGGERVWINECLTRAIALYLAQHSGRHYGTLFTDEADGALDPERKRMFLAMKREVIRLGGYEQEYFVSQTPELSDGADAVLNLADYRTVRSSEDEFLTVSG